MKVYTYNRNTLSYGVSVGADHPALMMVGLSRGDEMIAIQVEILREIQDTGFNVITCSMCGEVNLIRKAHEMFTCYACSEEQQHHDCADLFF